MDAIFEISSLENPYIPNFIKIGLTFDFGHLTKPHYKPIYSKIQCDLDDG